MWSCHAKPPAPAYYVALKWNPPANAGCVPASDCIMFHVMRAQGGAFTEIISTSALNYNDAAVVDGESYQYEVLAVNVYGASPPSNVLSLSIP